MTLIKRLMKDESGQAMSEYGLVLGIIVVAVITTLVAFKDAIVKMFAKITEQITGHTPN